MVQLSASADFTCGVTSRRTVKCWGAVPPRTSLALQVWTEVLQVSSADRGVCAIYGKAMLACSGKAMIALKGGRAAAVVVSFCLY